MNSYAKRSKQSGQRERPRAAAETRKETRLSSRQNLTTHMFPPPKKLHTIVLEASSSDHHSCPQRLLTLPYPHLLTLNTTRSPWFFFHFICGRIPVLLPRFAMHHSESLSMLSIPFKPLRFCTSETGRFQLARAGLMREHHQLVGNTAHR
jgi:hypothetical protein